MTRMLEVVVLRRLAGGESVIRDSHRVASGCGKFTGEILMIHFVLTVQDRYVIIITWYVTGGNDLRSPRTAMNKADEWGVHSLTLIDCAEWKIEVEFA